MLQVKQLGSARHKRIQVEILAIKWQDRCLQVSIGQTIFSQNALFRRTLFWQELDLLQHDIIQVRLASQELLVAELKNMGPTGRKHLVEVNFTTILLIIKIGKKKLY